MSNSADYKDNLIDLNNPAIKAVLPLLLCDKTTGHNIIWATNSYSHHGAGYDERDEITTISLNGLDNMEFQPRVYKSLEAQKNRTKSKAEVFTPSWICNLMNNHVNEQWFKRPNVFNVMDENHNWKSKNGKIGFKELKHTWQDYVYLRVIEITCGEAPYLVSKYDTVTGKPIKISKRIGMLDRKLRVVNENTTTEGEWFTWVKKAYQSTYGYEWQGDNLLIARINMLLTFIDYMEHKWDREPKLNELKEISKIIVWNIFQMDGLTYEVPLGGPVSSIQMSIDDENVVVNKSNCVIVKNWRNGKDSLRIPFNELTNKEIRGHMKFDVAIFNPPYQEEMETTSDKPIYPAFLDAAYEIADIVETITPGRFLFNAGKTKVDWNKKMLADEHIKVVLYEQDSSKIFATTDIKGGVVVLLRNKNVNYNAIQTFTVFEELRTIKDKVSPSLMNGNLSQIMYQQNRFNLDTLYGSHPEVKKFISSDGKEQRIISSYFSQMNNIIFFDHEIEDSFRILGIVNGNKRCYKYISKKFVQNNEVLNKYKVLIPFANGSGAIGEVLSTPLVGVPLVGYTKSFIGIGCFDKKEYANNLLKYVSTKFVRTLLGILKTTQGNAPKTWIYVPLQDFTENSDIDWTKSISDIDKQLYKKYGLDEKEIAFIESKVKSMDDEIVEDEEDSNEKND